MLTPKQAQKLLRLVCIKSLNLREIETLGENLSHKRATAKILDNLDEWNLRISAVELKLMYHQVIIYQFLFTFHYQGLTVFHFVRR